MLNNNYFAIFWQDMYTYTPEMEYAYISLIKLKNKTTFHLCRDMECPQTVHFEKNISDNKTRLGIRFY